MPRIVKTAGINSPHHLLLLVADYCRLIEHFPPGNIPLDSIVSRTVLGNSGSRQGVADFNSSVPVGELSTLS
ncbi:MAG: hypothetical protein AB1589_34985 [Cyanobacteriota bacterium]